MGVMLDVPWNGVVFTPPTAIDIATIEDAIVNRLSSQINSIEIAHYPDQSRDLAPDASRGRGIGSV